jgi:membrane-associated phospholipid phosphatase
MTVVDRRPPVAWSYALAAAVLLAALTVLAIVVANHPRPSALDREIDDMLRAPDESSRYAVFRVIGFSASAPAVAVTAVVMSAASWWLTRNVRLLALCLAAPAVSIAVELLLKQVVARPAPSAYGHGTGLSFPSGHVTGASALAAALVVGAGIVVKSRRRGTLAVVALAYVVAVGIARLVLAVHHATDVVGGALLGAGVTFGLWALLSGSERRAGIEEVAPTDAAGSEHPRGATP